MQFHIPSVEQTPVNTPDVTGALDGEVILLASTDGDEIEVELAAGTTGATLEGVGTRVAATTLAVDVAAADEGAIVAKTPPKDGLLETRTPAVETVDLPVARLNGEEPEPVETTPDWPATAAAHPVPVGVARAATFVDPPSCSRESPGFGKRTSFESAVVHPLPMFAVNMFGRALKAAVSRLISIARLVVAEEKETGAQFMYISRLPILLNHVQASVALPVGKLVGIVKE